MQRRCAAHPALRRAGVTDSQLGGCAACAVHPRTDMHFINASLGSPSSGQLTAEEQYETILERMTQIVEYALQVTIRRDTFNYARFATHVQYLLKRVQADSSIDSDNLQVYASIRDEYRDVSACVDQIHEYLQRNWSIDLSEEEKLYLIMHINRVISQEL